MLPRQKKQQHLTQGMIPPMSGILLNEHLSQLEKHMLSQWDLLSFDYVVLSVSITIQFLLQFYANVCQKIWTVGIFNRHIKPLFSGDFAIHAA